MTVPSKILYTFPAAGLVAGLVVLILLVVPGCGAPAPKAPVSTEDAARLMAPIHAVLTSPRCLNCHTMTDYPRQGADRHPHQFGVVRGPDDRGVLGLQCSTCHRSENQPDSGVPGAKGWHLAPRSMTWESEPGVAMTPAELCRSLLDRTRNGDLSLEDLEEHMDSGSLVVWAWSPGIDTRQNPRSHPPLSHQELMVAFKAWIDAGAPCPP